MNKLRILGISSLMLLVLAGCSSTNSVDSALSGSITIDGSSTVAPITEAVIEEFTKEVPNVKINMGISGTGGGFKRFTTNETSVQNASRPIKKEESDKAKANGVEYVELEVAKDAITVAVNPKNTWAQDLSHEQLKTIWSKPNEGIKWSDIDPSWPQEVIKLYGPGADSGTRDYFLEEVIGKDGQMRTDFIASEDDNVLVTGVSGDINALGYFGYVYYIENESKLSAIAIDGVLPTEETVLDGTYKPLSRPLFVYVNKGMYDEDESIKAFIDFYLDNATEMATAVGYIGLDADVIESQKAKLK